MVLLILSHYPVRYKSTNYHQGIVAERSKALINRSGRGMAWVQIPLETYIFILNFSIPAYIPNSSLNPMQMKSSMTIHP